MPVGSAVYSGSFDGEADASVQPLVRKAAAWSWRLLVMLGALVALLWLVKQLEVIVVPVLLATMVTAMLVPSVDFLDRRGVPRGAAVAGVLLSAVVVVGGILAFVVSQFIEGAPALVGEVTQSMAGARKWLDSGLLAHFSNDQIKSATDTVIEALKNNQAKLTSGALSTAGTVTEIVTGALLMFFTLIFLLQGGRNIFAFVTLIFPTTVRERVRDSGRADFQSLIGSSARRSWWPS